MNQIGDLLDTFKDAKEYGSILNVADYDWDLLRRFAESVDVGGQMTLDAVGIEQTQKRMQMLIDIGEVMARKYEVVVTNPPYMGISNGNAKLSEYVKKNYPDRKSDLFAVFIEKCTKILQNNGFQAMITQHSWMFLSSYEKLRKKMLLIDSINMVHLGARAFEEISGEVVQTTAFVRRNVNIKEYASKYYRLIWQNTQKGKEEAFLAGKNCYVAKQSDYAKIPGSPFAYWVSINFMYSFEKHPKLGEFVECAAGISTGDNDKYLKLWFEIQFSSIAKGINSEEEFQSSQYKYAFCNKGGGYRKWYGNNDYVAYWKKSNEFHRNGATYKHLLFIEGITWNEICLGNFNSRYYPNGVIFDHKSPGMFTHNTRLLKLYLGMLNSKVASYFLNVINPTISTGADSLRKVPIANFHEKQQQIEEAVNDCIKISEEDWDFFETSWNFAQHPLIRLKKNQKRENKGEWFYRIEDSFIWWENECDIRFNQLKINEEELNRIFIDIYGLQGELTPEVEDKDVTVRKADLQRDIKSLISYAVGCMFGRYSLDVEGLAYAGGDWDNSKYDTFIPDKDNIIPITDEEYFEDDILGLFCSWLKKVYGKDTLEQNLDFIASALKNKGDTSREIIRNYFVNDFFKDHCTTYSVTGSGKRPIYWLFDSGKQNGFKALIYLHRYNIDTVGNLRVDYLHRMQRIYESEIGRMQDMIDHSTNSREVGAAAKRKEKLQKQLKECRDYDEKIGHLALSRIELDLDDGVKVNYEKVQTAKDGKKYQVLAKV